MARKLLLLALLWPLTARAADKARSDVEIWPPPAPDTDQAGEKKPSPKPPSPPPDAGDALELDPELTGPGRAPETSAPEGDAPAESPCAELFDDCREDCIVVHANDDTLHVPRGKKLPVEVCVGRCEKRRRVCEEQREAGFEGGKRSSDAEE